MKSEPTIIPVKSVKQNHNYDCGAAALKSISHYYGISLGKEREFIKLCDTGKRKGTHPDDIVRAANALGLKAKLRSHMTLQSLKSLLDRRIPVICAIQAWGDPKDYDKPVNGHYVVAVGYDDKNIYFEDPSLKGPRGFIHSAA
jgi:predicted double-glycine peptidase